MDKPLLLIVDDEPDMAEYIEDVAVMSGFQCKSFVRASDFISYLGNHTPYAVILDIVMPDIDGIELIRALGDMSLMAPIVLVSGYDPSYLEMASAIAEGKDLKIYGTLTKPLMVKELEDFFERLIRELA